MVDEIQEQELDLDEDIFGFEGPEATDYGDDEELDSIFAAFHAAEESAEETEDEPTPEHVPQAIEPAPVVEPIPAPFPSREPRPLAPELFAAAAEPQPPSQAAQEPAGKTAFSARALAASVPRGVAVILLAITAVNALVALVTLRQGANMRDSVLEANTDIREAAERMRADSVDQAREIMELRTPIVPPDPESHPTFERAREEIELRDYTAARKRLYALLAVVDRLEESQRREVEARAQYLLAEATHREALEHMEVRP